MKRSRILFLAILLVPFWLQGESRTSVQERIAGRLEREIVPMIEKDLACHQVPGLSVALVLDGEVIWKQGFGYADPERRTAATPETIYRVASISKLFNAVAVIQQKEAGQLDIDADLKTYLPDMTFRNPFETTAVITLRHLLSHRADIARECPVGHYFDDTEPTLEATVRSIAGTSLVYPPGSRSKYSNIGVGVAGFILQKIAAQDFASYEWEHILKPLGMTSSSFLPEDVSKERLAKGIMRDRDGNQWPAPHFRFGYVPAANLYSTVLDLAKFINFVLEEGRPLLKPDTFQEMLRVQFAGDKETRGFGLGFSLSRLHGVRSAGHNGALYGFSSNLLILPDEKLGVAVLNNLEGANGFNFKIVFASLGVALEEKSGKKILDMPKSVEIPVSGLKRYTGKYEKEGMPVWLVLKGEKLYIEPYGQRKVLTPISKHEFITDDLLGYGERIHVVEENGVIRGIKVNDLFYARAAASRTKLPAAWEKIYGDYGPDFNIMKIYPKDGKLTVLIEWFDEYPLQHVEGLRFRYPDYGMYLGEEILFKEKDGKIIGAEMALCEFKKRGRLP